MPPTSAVTSFLVTGMLVTGVANTLLTKYQDMQCISNCEDPDPSRRHAFEQPVMQTLQMFIGEMGCWLIIGCLSLSKWFQKRRAASAGYSSIDQSEGEHDDFIDSEDERIPMKGLRVFLLAIPACCDIAGTTLMNVGFLFVVASIYQMTRGALVLFVGLFSVIFLKRHLHLFQWFSLVVVVLGVALVGLAGALFKDPVPGDKVEATADDGLSPAVRTVIGILLIAFAQTFTASQFVVEEYILEKYALAPLKVVGWEGIFGFLVTVVGMVILHFTVGVTPDGQGGYFDAREGLYEITHFPVIAFSSIAIMVSIGGFNFFGISVTRSISATARSIIDTCRTLFIWIVSLGLGWESFKWLQIIGFGLLVYGTFLFNELVVMPWASCARRNGKAKSDDDQPRLDGEDELLPEHPIEHL